MKKEHIILGISVFLALLFVSTIGNMYTGYTILQKDITLKDYPYPFIKNNNYNNLYIVLPDSYTIDEYDSALVIAKSIQFARPLLPKIVRESDLPDRGEYNLILIGDPCTNSLIADYLLTNDCNLNLYRDQGLLELVNNDKTSVLVVSGYDLSAIKKSAMLLSKYNTYPIRNNRVVVSGNPNVPLGMVMSS